MCSTRAAEVVEQARSLDPQAQVEVLHGVLDQLLSADLATLGELERAELVTSLVTLEHRQHAALLDAIAAFDTADVASTTRHRTTSRWLQHKTRLAPGRAGGLTRTARALRDHLPSTRRDLAEGKISAAHVTAIAHVVRTVGAEHAESAEPILLELARTAEPTVVRRAAAHLHAVVDPDGAEAALQRTYERRGVTLSVAGDRAYLDGVLDIESAEVLRAALAPLMTPAGESDTRSAPQRRADAMVDLATRAMNSGTLPELGGQRPHLSVVIDESALRSRVGDATLPWTGLTLPAGAVRRWACDASLSPVVTRLVDGAWQPLDVGRSRRLASHAQLTALRVRDGGCVHPSCTRTPAYCDAHHVRHWADGGSTSVNNMVLLCRHHHRTLHTGHWSLNPDSDAPGRFWATTPGWIQAAQTAADRSPPLVPATS